MPQACTKCNQELGDKYAACDSCHSMQHPSEQCTGLSSSELRAVVLMKRTLNYFCEECRIAFRTAPVLLRELKKFKTEISSLRSEMNNLKIEVKSLLTENKALKTEINDLRTEVRGIKEREVSETTPTESIIGELLERQRRETNIMLANVREAQETTPMLRKEEDAKVVKEILQKVSVNVNLDNITIFRVGKVIQNKNRLIKVVMTNKNDAITIFRNMKNNRNIIPQGIRIFRDQTKKQKDFYLNVKKQLEELISNGDNSKTIKYINNVPTITNKGLNEKN